MIFTATLEIIIVKRKQYPHHWLGIVLVTIGISIVCVIDEYNREVDKHNHKTHTKLWYSFLVILS